MQTHNTQTPETLLETKLAHLTTSLGYTVSMHVHKHSATTSSALSTVTV